MKTLENFACHEQFKKTIQGIRATKKEFEDRQEHEALTNQRRYRLTVQRFIKAVGIGWVGASLVFK